MILLLSHTRSGLPLFYPCEITLPHIPVPAHEKDKNEQSHVNQTLASRRSVTSLQYKMTSVCRNSANSGFSGSLFHVFLFCFFSKLNEVLSDEQEKCEDRIDNLSLVMPIGDPWDGYSIPPSHS